MLEERQEGIVGPVQVLEHQHRGSVLGQVFQEGPPGCEVLLAGSLGSFQANQGAESLAEPWGIWVGIRDSRVDPLAGCLRRVGLQDPDLGFDDLAEGPERHGVPVG